MASFASFIGRALGRPAPQAEPAAPPLPVITLDKKLRMVAALLDHPSTITIAADPAGKDSAGLANQLADVFTRAGWTVKRRARASDGSGEVTAAFAQPFNLSPAERAILNAWNTVDLGPLRREEGEPGAAPEFRISGPLGG